MVSLSGFFPNILRGLFPAAERRDRNPGEKRAEEKDGERRSPGTAFRCASHDEECGRAQPLDAGEEEDGRREQRRPAPADEEKRGRNDRRGNGGGDPEARNEVKWETYTKKIQIEARVLGDLVMNHIVPVATEYQTKLIDNVYKMKSVFAEEEARTLSAENMAIIRKIAEHTTYIKEHVDAMVEARKVANKIASEREKAIAYHDTIAPMLEEIRYHIDKLELIVDDRMWTLPKYRELLFIR